MKVEYPKLPFHEKQNVKLTPEQVAALRAMRSQGNSYQACGDAFGVSLSTALYHCSQKERDRVHANRRRWQERAKTDPELHAKALAARARHQAHKIEAQGPAFWKYHTERVKARRPNEPEFAEKLRQRSRAWFAKFARERGVPFSYSEGNRCPTCGVPTSNGAAACKRHARKRNWDGRYKRN